MIYAARFETMNKVLDYLTENCCGGQPEKCMPVSRAKKRTPKKESIA
jgi:hypothetical protein